MPRSCSSAFESMVTPSPTMWVWRINASVKVVLPWSTCAIIAMLRISIKIKCRRAAPKHHSILKKINQQLHKEKRLGFAKLFCTVYYFLSSFFVFQRIRNSSKLSGNVRQDTTKEAPKQDHSRNGSPISHYSSFFISYL